jgi:hypothetical protein
MAQSVEHFSQPQYATAHRNRTGYLLAERHHCARAGWARYEPAVWLDSQLDAAARKRFSRALSELESAGTVECRRDVRGRVQWVRLARS